MTATHTDLEHRLRDTLLIHTEAARWDLAIERSDRDGGGIVFHGHPGLTSAEHVLARTAYRRPILLDAGAYAGEKRKFASEPFDDNWTGRQRRLGLPAVLPDAGYVAEDDELGLVSVLARVQDAGGNTVAPLALHRSWLKPDHGLPALLGHVADAGVPIAVALEHAYDPLSVRYVLEGLVDLLGVGVPVIVLRCDVSAIGALCFGALAAAVGTKTSLRHLYPMTAGGGGGGATASPAALVRELLSYLRLSRIDQGVAADSDNSLWQCGCEVCGGQDLSWINSTSRPEQLAYLHSVEVLYDIRRDLFEAATTAEERRRTWIAQCDAAVFRHLEIDTESFAPTPQKVLGNWISLRNREASA
ncbi:hypothetical protein [Saccharothrix sp. HUAS TT1]|uniref:hypothetical protein n=1 Tax=unclassified Saccharothrix TaxID=2593673 RepID=UPI00345C3B1F